MVDALLDAAFGPDRQDRTAYRVRAGMQHLDLLSFAAVDPEAMELLGTIQCWPIALTDAQGRHHPLIMVGPVAVHPDVQARGIGKALMQAMLAAQPEAADERLPLVMIGDPEYYQRFFGFSAERTSGWQLPGPWQAERLLLLADAGTVLPEAGMLGPWPL